MHMALHGLASTAGRRGRRVDFAVRAVELERLEFGELPVSFHAPALSPTGWPECGYPKWARSMGERPPVVVFIARVVRDTP